MKLRDFITEAPKIPSNVLPLSAYANPDNKRNRDEELSQMIKQQADDDIADAGKAKGTYLRFKPTANYMMKAYWGKDPHIQGIKDSEYFGNVKVINAYDYTELRRLVLELLRTNPYVHVIVSSEDKAAYPDYFSKLEEILEKVDAERISYEFDAARAPVPVQPPAVKRAASKSVSSTRSSISDEKAQQLLKQIATKFPSLYSPARRAEILDIIKQNDGKIGPVIDTLRIPESYSNKSASEFITEAMTNPYPSTLVSDTPELTIYQFKTDDGSIYRAQLRKHIDTRNRAVLEFAFGKVTATKSMEYGTTGKGDAFRIFATARDILLQQIAKSPPDYIEFLAEIENTGNDTDQGSRVRLYDKMISGGKLLPGYRLHSTEIISANGKLGKAKAGSTTYKQYKLQRS